MERLFDWLKQLKPKCPPKSNLYKAINYSLEREESLKIYLNHGTLNIDNNLAENKIRPFVLGRKNWMFMGNVAGANSSCNIYSLMETARMNNHNIRDYFNHVLTEIPKAKKSDDIEKLLPFNIYPEHIKPPDKK